MSKNSQIPGWKVVLTDKIKDYTSGEAGSVLMITTDANRGAVANAVRYLPSYKDVVQIVPGNGGIWVRFNGTWLQQRKYAMQLVADLEAVQEEVEALREAEEEAAGESGQFVISQEVVGQPVQLSERERQSLRAALGINQDNTVMQNNTVMDAKTILFGGLIIAAVILIFKK